ncbi:MAG: signal peptidase I [Oscillospiraceae bacterium]|jgi:signal peptidase I|nr:signal peptidase I [Oscillospiraceae bacterium]
MFEEYIPDEKASKRVLREVFDWVEAAMLAIVCVVLAFTFIVRMSVVKGDSMLPTLENGDRLLITRLGHESRASDIVVITRPENETGDPIVKRVIATGGQLVEIDGAMGEVRVDGVKTEESYILDPDGPTPVPEGSLRLRVPEGHVFVMGDNRNNSWDSRFSELGTIDARRIIGRAVYRVFPYEKAGSPG